MQLLTVELLKVLRMDEWSILTQHTNPRPNTPVIHATICRAGRKGAANKVECGQRNHLLVSSKVKFSSTTHDYVHVFVYGNPEQGVMSMICFYAECGPPSLGPYLRPKRREPVKCASTVEVECTYGHRLKGASVATCLPGPAYFWHGEMPSCI